MFAGPTKALEREEWWNEDVDSRIVPSPIASAHRTEFGEVFLRPLQADWVCAASVVSISELGIVVFPEANGTDFKSAGWTRSQCWEAATHTCVQFL